MFNNKFFMGKALAPLNVKILSDWIIEIFGTSYKMSPIVDFSAEQKQNMNLKDGFPLNMVRYVWALRKKLLLLCLHYNILNLDQCK